jgi:hypothetical protein
MILSDGTDRAAKPRALKEKVESDGEHSDGAEHIGLGDRDQNLANLDDVRAQRNVAWSRTGDSGSEIGQNDKRAYGREYGSDRHLEMVPRPQGLEQDHIKHEAERKECREKKCKKQ